MLQLILASVLFLILIIAAFIQHKHKLIAMSVCVTLLLVCNFINEIRASTHQTIRLTTLSKDN